MADRRCATLTIVCPDRPGLVAEVSGLIHRHGGNILAMDQHTDPDRRRFFMRTVWDLTGFALDDRALRAAVDALALRFAMTHELRFSDRRERVAVLASLTPHCLFDLLQAQEIGELGGEIVMVISNHEELRRVAEYHGVPFHHVPFNAERRLQAEAEITRLLGEDAVDLTVLARFMQVLSADFVAERQARIINIHHSFLPAFPGNAPYKQARSRGVKLIGATAHYVTAELDRGPIIDQDTARVSHGDSLADFLRRGRELERQVLTRAVRCHLERRVLVDDDRTVVFA